MSRAPALHQYPHHATRRRRREQARSKRKETKPRSEHGPRGPVDEGEEARRGNSSALESFNLTCDVTGDVMNTPRSYVDFTLHMTRTLRTTRKRAMGRLFFSGRRGNQQRARRRMKSLGGSWCSTEPTGATTSSTEASLRLSGPRQTRRDYCALSCNTCSCEPQRSCVMLIKLKLL